MIYNRDVQNLQQYINDMRVFIKSIVLAAGFFAIFLMTTKAHAATEVSGFFYAPQTWTKSQSPIVVTDRVGTGSGGSLTIEPGVVVKLYPGVQMTFGNGPITAVGTEAEPIIITSIYDDSVGGDTNGDGSATLPAAGDWYRISLAHAENLLENVEVRYGSHCLESAHNPVGTVTNSKISNCHVGFDTLGFSGEISENEFFENLIGVSLWTPNGAKITKNKFYNNTDEGILVWIVPVVGTEISGNDIFGNSTGIIVRDVTADITIENNNIYNNTDFGVENATPSSVVDATGNWWGDVSGPYHGALNPGGLGNPVSDGLVFDPWLDQEMVIGEEPPPVIDPVIVIPGILGSWEKNGELVIDPVLHTYDNLIATLDANYYDLNVNLFTFPYEWRNSNYVSALELKTKINEVKNICGCDKVDIIAHSMGGLVARAYIQAVDYEDDIDQIIFLGTPHLGATKDYLVWEGGEIGFGLSDRILKFVLNREARKNGYTGLFDYIRNRPVNSIEQLLPIFDYLRDHQSGALLTYPADYPRNIFLENLDNSKNLLRNSGAEIINVIGNGSSLSTIESIRIGVSDRLPLWEHGMPDGFYGGTADRGLEMGNGDKTVPESSGRYIFNNSMQVEASHNDMVTEAQGMVYKKLTGEEPAVLIDKFSFPGVRILFLKMLSPADMQVVAPDGSCIGKDFVTGQELNEIEHAFYSGFDTDNEFITILNPLDGEYKVIAQGTGEGEYTVASAYITNDSIDEKDFTSDTILGQEVDLTLKLDTSEKEIIEFGVTDSTPPEFTVEYSLDIKDFEILTVDNTDPDPTLTCTDTKCTAEDWAGNTSEIIFTKRNRSSTHSMRIKKLVNGDVEVMVPFNILFVRHRERRGEMKNFAQSFLMKRQEIMRVSYNTRKDESTIFMLEKGKGISKEKMSGIQILQLQTNQGTINTNIKN